MFIQTEATPNPATLKFLPGGPVLENGSREIQNEEEARISPLASALFTIDGVSGVFLGPDFISVTKSSGEWPHLKPAILGAIMEHFMSGGPMLTPGADGGHQDAQEFFAAEDSEIVVTIKDLIETRVQGWRRLFADERRLFRLPVFNGDAQAWHSKSALPFPSRGQVCGAGVIAANMRANERGDNS